MYIHPIDLPTILSGDKLAYLEPHEEIWKKETGRWYTIHDGSDEYDTFAPFIGLHNFAMGRPFSGTFFRFPLRDTARERRVSSHVYNVNKLRELLIALREEAKMILLFLRSVKSVEVHEISQLGERADLLKVCVQGEDDLPKRSHFQEEIKATFASFSYRIETPIELSIHLRVKVIDSIDLSNSSQSDWLIASRVGSHYERVHHVAQALKALPWVGIALEISSDPVGGRVFCVLPMPSEVSCHLPVHVNATFSLNDERRELKWSGIERKNDNSAEWNNLIIQHLLPPCYAGMLLKYAKQLLTNDKFYRAWPDVNRVRYTNWSHMLSPFFKQILSHRVFWSHNNQWASKSNAFFIPQASIVPGAVISLLSICGESVVAIPDKVWDIFTFMSIEVVVISPKITRMKLKQNRHSYSSFTYGQKLDLLCYCLSDNDYDDLIGLVLLPHMDCTFSEFLGGYRSEPVYVCSSQFPSGLIPSPTRQLLDVTRDQQLHENLEDVAKLNFTQLTMLNANGVAALLRKCLPRVPIVRLPHNILSLEWLDLFWRWVPGEELGLFSDLLVVPVFDSLSGTTHVVPLGKNYPTVFSTTSISEVLLSVFMKLHVNVCEQTKFTFLHMSNTLLMHQFSADGVLDAIYLAKYYRNVKLTAEEAAVLRQHLYSYTMSVKRFSVLNNMPIFQTLANSGERLYSTTQASCVNILPDNFPLNVENLPKQHILFSNSEYYQLWLLKSLFVAQPTSVDLIVDSLFPLVQGQAMPLMKEVLENIPSITFNSIPKQKLKLKKAIANLPFLPVKNGNILKLSTDLFDPSNEQIQHIFAGESVFPLDPFCSDKCLATLRACGLKTEVSEQDIFDILMKMFRVVGDSRVVCVDETAYCRARTILETIKTWNTAILQKLVTLHIKSRSYNLKVSDAIKFVCQTICWLPVKAAPPQAYPALLSWKGQEHSSHLTSNGPITVISQDELLELACGSQAYLIDHSFPPDICELLSPDPNILVQRVMAHLEVIVHSSQLPKGAVMTISQAVYQVLSKYVNITIRHQASLPVAWVYISRCNGFVSPGVVALSQNSSFRQNLEPFIYTLPDSLLSFTSLFESLGVEKVVSKKQILSVLCSIKDSDPKTLGVNDEDAWSLVMTILHWLTGSGSHAVDPTDCSKLYVPVEDSISEGEHISLWPRLVQTENVVYTDNDFLRRYIRTSQYAEHSYEFVNRRISPQLAHQLRITPLSHYLEIAEDVFEDVGQCEPLTVRLKNILKDYKDGLTIIKELLQNADDANATEVNICYDARNHSVSSDSLLFPGMAGCHGPALVVHNNAMFTQKDFKNITKLAGATKEDQTLKIGKFGVGFCSVYHMTDIPSFISDQYLFIFDPTLTFLKEEVKNPDQPGKKVVHTTNVVMNSQQLAPYDGLFNFKRGNKYNGTMFRFPFRTAPSELSENVYTLNVVQRMFEDMRNSSSKMLLFLQSIKCITASRISGGEKLPTEQIKIEKKERTLGLVTLVIISCTCGDIADTNYWLVSKHTETVLGKVATSSVACSVSMLHAETLCLTVERTEGEVFCFLPLSMKIGLPVHVSSNFAVSNNRTAIWSSDDSSKNIHEVKWNKSLMQTVISKAYMGLLLVLKQMYVQNMLMDYNFFSLWPLTAELTIHNPWKLLLTALYHYIEESALFFSECTAKWISLPECRFLSPEVLSTNYTLPECVLEVVKCMKLPIVDLPQQYYAHINISEQNMVTENAFLTAFFLNIEEVPIKNRNRVLCLALECFTTQLDEENTERKDCLQFFLSSNACIPCDSDGKLLRKCSEVVNPKAKFASLYEKEDGLFPVQYFCQKQLVLKAMEELNIIDSPIPMHMLIERANTVKLLHEENTCRALERSQLIVKCLMSYDYQEEDDAIARISFLPVMPKPNDYVLQWYGNTRKLLSGEKLMLKGMTRANIRLAGSQVPFTYELEPRDGGCGCIGYQAQKVLKIRVTPMTKEVIEHFKHVINVYCSLQNKSEKIIQETNAIVHDIYKCLDDELRKRKQGDLEQTDSDLKLTLSNVSCVWTGTEFVSCDKVAMEWKLEHGPYLYRVPRSHMMHLWEALEIKPAFIADDLIKALQEISNDYRSNELSCDCQKIVHDIISELNNCEVCHEHPVIMLPDPNFVMHPASSLAYNDAPWLPCGPEHTYVHKAVSRDLAEKLGVKMVRSELLHTFRHSKRPIQGQHFGQHEKLTTRIQGILKDYPFDVTILKELLQNADDAKATKFHVILDTRTHNGNRVLSEKWEKLQGPALLVWNDKQFSESDIEGIQKLGMGNKQSDAETIGQYGIGFNSVYHLTDCPSFISGGTDFCIFDPHCKYTPDSTTESPGERFKLSGRFWTNFPDMKPAYLHSNVGNCPKDLLRGSLFRFPLRHTQELLEESEIVSKNVGRKIFEGVVTAKKMQSHLQSWAPQMKQSMFFLNHVIEIKFYTIDESNNLNLKHHYCVDIDKEAIAERKKLHDKVKTYNGGEPFITKYQLSLVEVTADTPKNERWLIQQGIGDIANKEQKWLYIQQVKPRHGLAAPLKFSGRFRGKVFCFLPLPIDCNLPVHINGHFILHSSRRSLWKTTDRDDIDSKQQWNTAVLNAIASSYAHLLIAAKQDYGCDGGKIIWDNLKKYYRVFPSWTAPLKHSTSVLGWKADSDYKHHKTSKPYESIAKPVVRPAVSTAKYPKYQRAATSATQTLQEAQLMEDSPALPSDEWLALAKNVFKALANKNASVIAIVHPSPPQRKSGKIEHTVEWCPLKDKDPASQVYFVSKDSPNSVLERIGMKLTHIPHWIRKHFDHVGCSIPEISTTTAYKYYCEFHENMLLRGDSLPCSLRNTLFQSIDNFKVFLVFILPALKVSNTTTTAGDTTVVVAASKMFSFKHAEAVDSHKSANLDIQAGSYTECAQVVDDTIESPKLCYPPLIVTADGILRPYLLDEIDSKVIKSSYSSLFQKCLQWFLHPTLFDVKIPEIFILDPSKVNDSTCLKRVNDCVASILPHNLSNAPCVPFSSQIKFKKLWECLSDDDFFKTFLKHILKSWALLLSRDNILYSCFLQHQAILPILLPLSNAELKQESDLCKVSMVYQNLSLPFLNTEIVLPRAVKDICPTLPDREFMLRLLYNFNSKYDISRQVNSYVSKTLLDYFAHIHLKKDVQSLEYLQNLPLFLTHTGKFTSLTGKEVYVWPSGMCTAGQEIWLNKSDPVFLDRSGAWSNIGLEELGVYDIYPVEIYTKYIFRHFSVMSEKLRYQHLLYIRESLFQDAKNHSHARQSDKASVSLQFIEDLNALKCIGSDYSHLRAISEFYDFKNKIFKTFKEKYLFLPKCFKACEEVNSTDQQSNEEFYAEWRDFLNEFGLHCRVTTDDFLELCCEMANGEHATNTRAKSNVLFEHLFKNKTQEWFSDSYFVSKVVEIPFVFADEGTHYTWIAPVQRKGTRIIQTNAEPVCLTKLNGACVYEDISLLWTVKPVYHAPWENKPPSVVLSRLKLRYKATESDVVKHLINISASGRTSPTLFDTYTAPLPGEHDKGLIEVIAKCFDFLNKSVTNETYILMMTPCIPVPVSANSRNKFVLVKPPQALTTAIASIFSPYLHTVPYELMVYNELLEKIGVKQSLELCHLQLVLNTLHERVLNNVMDPNIVDMVCHALDQIQARLLVQAHDNLQAGRELSPLYLPGSDNRLHLSSHLLYPDVYSYKTCQLPTSTALCLLHHPNTSLDQYDFANVFCKLLPQAVRPKPLSEFCVQQPSMDCSASEDVDMALHLKTALKLYMLPFACQSMLLKHADGRFRHDGLVEKLKSFFRGVEVVTVENLKVDVVLKSDRSTIGSASVDYFLQQEHNAQKLTFCLYLNSRVGRIEEEHIHKTMAQELLEAVSKTITGSFLEGNIQNVFSLFLKSQTDDDVKKVCQFYGINLNHADIVHELLPIIGNEIPEEWQHVLVQNPCNIFHPQEIVGYETSKGHYVFAKVLYVILPDEMEDEAVAIGETCEFQTKYKIVLLEREEIVTALEIYKLLTTSGHSPMIIQEIQEQEEGIQYTSVADAKRQLCVQLRQIWTLSEPERSTAIRRLYLKWHPDKNLENIEMASDVFKYLLKQIECLHQGLDLDDEDSEVDDVVSSSEPSPWKEHFSSWEQTARSHKRHRDHHSEHFKARPSTSGASEDAFVYRPQPNCAVGTRWVEQATIDFRALEVLYAKATEDPLLSSHVCFMAHEVAEKALKGGMYATCGLDAGFLANHQIYLLANMLRGEKPQIASGLPSLTSPLQRHYLDTRFPNRCAGVPSHNYCITDAQQAQERAREILRIVLEILQECMTS